MTKKSRYLFRRMLAPLTIILSIVSVVIAAVICTPPIPRTVTRLNAPTNNPLTDRIVAKCTAGEPKEGAVLVGQEAHPCTGYTVESKIRWDSADSGHGITVVGTNRQLNGDLRILDHTVATWSCASAVPSWSYYAKLIGQPCEAASGEASVDTFQDEPIGCGYSPDYFGNCQPGTSANGCNKCCSDAERDACWSTGWLWNAQGGGFCRDPSGVCFEQQNPCDVWGESWNEYACGCAGPCAPTSPILVDVSGDGFDLTDNAGGVSFDFNGDNTPERLSWTTASSDDAWLVLDRDGDGAINKGAEMFGNFTYQREIEGKEKQGFLALSQFDDPANVYNGGHGGNGDGKIDLNDSIFTSLRLWQDSNHNGISESSELHTLSQLGIVMLELKHKESKRADQHGNQFRYGAKVKDVHGAQVGRWAWDVFLVPLP